ncbi:hypothetical protein C7974DRAFT_370975 [Boeremia exigua]|uniref:uncharacterized protein n=1 Tax=Boeremia exigua TaxID=749465 RepID=UPI001E8CFB8A|nr:uncharacterized protein C7974DRAFT_370975 [Boeremia exigua]KAH6643774.1 hypothetical protein C7974DRAFT_370975 [Boeremia exigua]
MYLYPIESLRLNYEAEPTEVPSTADPDGLKPLDCDDRSSAVVLGIILVLILYVLGCVCLMRVKKRKGHNTERWPSRQAVTTTEHGRSSSEEQSRYSVNWKSLFGPKMSRLNRGESATDRNGDSEKGHLSWPSTSSLSHTRGMAPCHETATLQTHRRSVYYTRPLSPPSQPEPREEPFNSPPALRHASHHRRQSSVYSMDLDAPTRRGSLPKTQHNRRQRRGLASHGGCTARASQRISTLPPILEPKAVP